MRQFLAILFSVCLSSSAADWFVAPGANGNGTLANPGAFLVACAHTNWASSIGAGDTIWLRGGLYTNLTFQTRDWYGYPIGFSGANGNPVTWRSYSNEWAVIDGGWDFGQNSFHRFRNVEFFDSHKDQHVITGYEAQDGPIQIFRAATSPLGKIDGMFEFINCVLHDTRSPGIRGQRNRGCIFWNVTKNGYEHISYAGSLQLLNNIVYWCPGRFVNYGMGNGANYHSNIVCQTGGGIFSLNGITSTMIGNRIWVKNVGWTIGLDATSTPGTTAYDNTFAFSQKPLRFSPGTSLTFRTNTVIQMWTSEDYPVMTIEPGGSVSWDCDFNTYRGYTGRPVRFEEGSSVSFSTYRGNHPNLDAHSTALDSTLPPDAVHIYPNIDQAKRAHIAIYNWSQQPNVTVDLGNVLSVGDPYRIWSAQDFNRGPLVTGIYSAPISLPMTNLSVAPLLYTTTPFAPTAQNPEFAAFLVIGPTDPANPYPGGGSLIDTNPPPANNAPTANTDSYSTAEDTQLVVAAPGLLANDSDPDGNSITASLVSGVSHGTLSLNANGSFTYTPTANYNGSDSFVYRAYDGQAYSGNATVSITVTAVNDAPVAVADSYSTEQDASIAVAYPGVLNNDTDADNNTLTAIKVSDPAHGTLSLASDGSFGYTPTPGWSGTDSFTYRASDGTDQSSSATVTITVSAATPPATNSPSVKTLGGGTFGNGTL